MLLFNINAVTLCTLFTRLRRLWPFTARDSDDLIHDSYFQKLFLQIICKHNFLKRNTHAMSSFHVLTLKTYFYKNYSYPFLTIGVFEIFLFKDAIFGAECSLKTQILVLITTFVYLYSSCNVIFFTPVYTSNLSFHLQVSFRLGTLYLR